MFYKILISLILCAVPLLAMDEKHSFPFQDLPKDLQGLVLAHAYKKHDTPEQAAQQFKTLTLVSKDTAQVAKSSSHVPSIVKDLLNKYNVFALDIVICLTSPQALAAFKQQFNKSFIKLSQHIKKLTNTITITETVTDVKRLLGAFDDLKDSYSQNQWTEHEFEYMAIVALLAPNLRFNELISLLNELKLHNKNANFLWHIIKKKRAEFTKLVLNVHPDTKNSGGWTKLILAANYGNNYLIRLLLTAGADINLFDDSWRLTALMAAIRNGNTMTVELLLNAGADLNLQNVHGQTALYMAAFATNLEQGTKYRLVKMLLGHGASTVGMNMTEQCKLYWSYIVPRKIESSAHTSACTIV